MQILQFRVEQLHGFLDLTIPFYEDLTVIVGVNGSGKTSALTLMSALLRLDAAAVRRFKFQLAELTAVSRSGEQISVIAAATDQGPPTISLTIAGASYDVTAHSSRDVMHVTSDGRDFLIDPEAFDRTNSGRSVWTTVMSRQMLYMGVTKEAYAAAKQFLAESRLTFVQLDRTIVAVAPDGEESSERPQRSSPKARVTEPIDEVIRVTKKKFLDYKNATERIKDRAYRDSLRLHFEPISSAMQDKKVDRTTFMHKLRDMKSRVAKSGLASDEIELKSFSSEFFDEFQKLFEESAKQKTAKRTGRRTLDEEQLDAILNLKRWQIERLLAVFEAEAKSTQEEYAPIRRYLAATEKFFRESGKRLVFNEDYELGFVLENPDLGPDPKPRSLKELSSGERQILIILTYLAFVSGTESVFVIDEPELSLHLVWQALLVSAVKDLRPSGCQVILATHAPEIAGRARDRSIRLGRKPLN